MTPNTPKPLAERVRKRKSAAPTVRLPNSAPRSTANKALLRRREGRNVPAKLDGFWARALPELDHG